MESIAAVPVLILERASRREFIVRNVDDRLVAKGRAAIFVCGHVLEPRRAMLVTEGEVIRVGEYTLRIGKPRLPLFQRDVVEERFLSRLRDAPNDEDTRSVYADWLEEHDQPSGAAFLRTGEASGEASRDVEDEWRSLLARPAIESCAEANADVEFEFECPKEWTRLERTANAKVRFCHACEKTVTYCETIREARAIASAGGCVAVDPSLTRKPNDLELRLEVRLGALLLR